MSVVVEARLCLQDMEGRNPSFQTWVVSIVCDEVWLFVHSTHKTSERAASDRSNRRPNLKPTPHDESLPVALGRLNHFRQILRLYVETILCNV
jgi:hypothetical protein